ncbi:MAG TPA: YjbE family putative metal transport protein [Gammaproteobacteria bacterium]|nr:YjbE family putative metal transport protein [Gammaproteobacteria bacterium]
MQFVSAAEMVELVEVVFVNLVLSADNAIVVGIAVAGLPARNRLRAMALGIAGATVLRILFALVTTELLSVVGLKLAGGVLLLWICSKLWRELRTGQLIDSQAPHEVVYDPDAPASAAPPKTMQQAMLQIVVADVSMSLDNVLAVAGVAGQHWSVLVIGLVLSIVFMGLAAALIARLLGRYHWIAYVGLAIIVYVSLRLILDGTLELVEAVG